MGDMFFGKTRRAILSLLYGHPDEEYYLRQVVRLTGSGNGAIQRELAALHRAGIIERTTRGHLVYFRADSNCPVYDDIKNLVGKTLGASEVLRTALAPLANRIRFAFIYGSLAHGAERRASDIDVAIVGETTFAEISRALGPVQEKLQREINPTVYSPDEFRTKLRDKHHFLTSITKEQKTFLIGNEHEFARMAEEWLAD